MVAALYSNPNWDDKANDRPARLKEINEHFNHTIELIYNPDIEDENEPDWENPFWQAHLREMQRTKARLALVAPGGTVRDAVESEDAEAAKLRDLERRAKLREGLDQVNGR